eukprot:1156183-Pelagomonas_calceolata.AAC.16
MACGSPSMPPRPSLGDGQTQLGNPILPPLSRKSQLGPQIGPQIGRFTNNQVVPTPNLDPNFPCVTGA